MKIDAHHHLWDLKKRNYSWMSSDLKPLYRNFLVEDLAKTVASHKITGTVVVQAHQSVEETLWLLELAEKSDLILGVVGWVDLNDPELGKTLAELKKHKKFKGVRHLIQDEPDGFSVQAPFVEGVRLAGRFGLTVDLCVRNHQITETACRKCHTEMTASIDPFHTDSGRGGLTCTKCHNEVGHIE